MSARLLAAIMRDLGQASGLAAEQWNALIAAARAEQMIGNLAARLQDCDVPAAAQAILGDARAEAVVARRRALWEADRARDALEPLGIPVVLLKGSAYVAAGLKAGEGRSIGDLDILVPCEALDAVEAALLGAGWEWVKPDPYDDAYYRQWMHELPPLIHRERDRMIDVHHTILPLTARPTPDADVLIADSILLPEGTRVLAPADMICHAAAHLFADGDLAGGLRNLWDIRCLLDEFADRLPQAELMARAAHHGLSAPVAQALRMADHLYKPGGAAASLHSFDRAVRARILARDGWGRTTRPLTRLGFYIRSHWLRMPPTMLASHLFTKWRKRSG